MKFKIHKDLNAPNLNPRFLFKQDKKAHVEE